nr:flagellar protein FlaG [uncultured Agathobacter sp.]
MAIEAIKGAGMVYQGSTSTAQVKEESQSKAEVSSKDNQMVSDTVAKETQAMNTKEASGDTSGEAGSQSQAQLAAQKQNEKNMQLKKAVDDINKRAVDDQSEAVFGIHDKTNRITIKIIDKKTKEVIKEFPPEKTLDMIAKVWEMAGLMVDEKR